MKCCNTDILKDHIVFGIDNYHLLTHFHCSYILSVFGLVFLENKNIIRTLTDWRSILILQFTLTLSLSWSSGLFLLQNVLNTTSFLVFFVYIFVYKIYQIMISYIILILLDILLNLEAKTRHIIICIHWHTDSGWSHELT